MDQNEIIEKCLRTPLCVRMGLRYPVFQAGMGLIAQGELAAAVSEAGGLGVIGAEGLDDVQLRQHIRMIRDQTDKPFGVDILFAQARNTGADNVIQYTDEVNAKIAVVLEEKVPVLISGLGTPKAVVPDAHALGITVMSVVGNVRQARKIEQDGVDVVIAQGHEAGGHTGRIGTIALLPQVVDAVNIPVLAAGGLADGRSLVAALALGAQGVWMGTRFVASKEAYAHENYKNKVAEIDEEGTTISRGHSGKTARLIRNEFTDYWEKNADQVKSFPQQFVEVGRAAARKARYEGKVEEGGLPAGQISGLIKSVEPAGKIVASIMQEAVATLQSTFLK